MGKEDGTVRHLLIENVEGLSLHEKYGSVLSITLSFLQAKKQVQIFTLFIFLVHLHLSLLAFVFVMFGCSYLINIHFYLGGGWEGRGIVLITCIVLFRIWRIEMYGYANQTVIWHSSTRMSDKCTYASAYSNSLCGGSVTKCGNRKKNLPCSLHLTHQITLNCFVCVAGSPMPTGISNQSLPDE